MQLDSQGNLPILFWTSASLSVRKIPVAENCNNLCSIQAKQVEIVTKPKLEVNEQYCIFSIGRVITRCFGTRVELFVNSILGNDCSD